MTEDRAQKQAIRRRMEQTGEKYTEARRALLADAAGAERPPWHDESYWENLLRQSEELAARHGEAAARVAIYGSLQSHQLAFSLMPFKPPGWPVKRSAAEYNAAAIAASTPLVAAGFGRQIERNRQIVERVLALIDERPATASPQPQKKAEDRRARLQREGKFRSRLEGMAAGPPRASEVHEWEWLAGDRALRQPQENWFLACARGIADPMLLELLDAWVEDLRRNYRDLVDAIPDAWREHGELHFEALIDDREEGEAGGDWTGETTGLPSPACVRVERHIKGAVDDRDHVATNELLIEGRHSTQPDGIAAIAGERWHIRGHRLADGTIMPCWGTYRVASAAAS